MIHQFGPDGVGPVRMPKRKTTAGLVRAGATLKHYGAFCFAASRIGGARDATF